MAFVVMRMRNVVGLARLARRAELTHKTKNPATEIAGFLEKK
jgi:hypothetical protein